MTSSNPLLARIACLVLAASISAACSRAPVPLSEARNSEPPAVASAPPASAPLPLPTEPTGPSEPSVNAGSDLRCKTNADCAVKDVGSCCGYQPRCLNKEAQTFPEQVKAQCAKDGRAGICGFQEIASCECVSGQCAASASPGGILVQ